ncbi:MAG: hypothetical protein J6K92_04565 [Oscillospiraceae bacterium]|nr:hypothetical protein [Oscillospiraceae bacterium]
MEMTLVLITVIFAAAALLECFCGFASVRAALTRGEERTVMLIPITDKTGDAEFILRQAADMMERSYLPCRCVIVDMGADEETLEICRRFISEHGGFEMGDDETMLGSSRP